MRPWTATLLVVVQGTRRRAPATHRLRSAVAGHEKGGTAFAVRVLSGGAFSDDQTRAMEKTLALDVLAKL